MNREWFVECVITDDDGRPYTRHFGPFESRDEADAELWANQGDPLLRCDEGTHSLVCDIPDGARVLPPVTTRRQRVQWQARVAASRSAR